MGDIGAAHPPTFARPKVAPDMTTYSEYVIYSEYSEYPDVWEDAA